MSAERHPRQWKSILSNRGRLWARLVLTVWLLAAILPAYAAELSGTVVGVHDGDAVTVLDAGKFQHKIRLAGSDAPELNQPFGRVSRQHLADQVAGRIVVITDQRLARADSRDGLPLR